MISPRSLRDVCSTRTSGISSGIVICAFVIFVPCSVHFALILSLLIPPYLAGITAIPNEPHFVDMPVLETIKIMLYFRRSHRRAIFWEIVLITLNDGLMRNIRLFCWADASVKTSLDWQEGF